MSYESDPSGQSLPGDSDSLNRAGQTPSGEQNSWLLDGETTPLASQPTEPETLRPADSPNWLLDGEQAEEPSLVITEDTDGDSWLMNVDDQAVTLDVDEVSGEPGFSASYCEPESTASVFGRLLVPAVFVSVLSVGGLLVWRSMSGLGVGPDDSNQSGVVHVPSGDNSGEKLAGPTFEVPGSTRLSGGASTRGSIQRDGSVKQSNPSFTASTSKGQFGFTPSGQSPAVTPEVADSGQTEPLETTPVETGAVAQVEPQTDQSPEVTESSVVEESTAMAAVQDVDNFVIDFFGMALFTADLEAGTPELYEVEPSQGRLLSFHGDVFLPVVGLPLWGPGTPVEPAIALEMAEALAEASEPDVDAPVEPLLTSEQEAMLAMADGDGSVELPFLWVEDTVEETPEGTIDAPLAMVEPSEPETFTEEMFVEETMDVDPEYVQESAAVAALEDENTMDEGTPLGRAFLDQLLAMGPIETSEVVPEANEGFDVQPLENWIGEGGDEVAMAEMDSGELASVEVEPLPLSAGLDEQGSWLIGDGYEQPEVTGPVAMAQPTEAEQAFVELWSEEIPVEDAPVSVASPEDQGSALAQVDPTVTQHSVPTDIEIGTLSSIEPMIQDDSSFEVEEIGMVPAPTVDWVDPLAHWTSVEEENSWLPTAGDLELTQETEVVAATEEPVVPVLVGELEGEPELLVDDLATVKAETTETTDVDVAEVETTGTDVAQTTVEESTELIGETPLEVLAEVDEVVDLAGETTEVVQVTVDELTDEPTVEVAAEPTDDVTVAQVEELVESTGVEILEPTVELVEVTVEPTVHGETPATEFETDGTPTALVAEETTDEVGPVAVTTPEPTAVGTPAKEGETAMDELLSVAPTTAPETTTESESETVQVVEESGERSLLDMYSDWNQAEDEGQLQPLSSSKWVNFSVDGGEALPFRMAQTTSTTPQEERAQEQAPVEVQAEETKPRMGVLKRRKADDTHWNGMEVPMHALSNEKILLTPNVGPVRVIATDGETIEGRLHGMGQNYVWLTTNLGRLSIPSRRVERVERIDPNQFSTEVKSTQDYTKLPKVRVRMKGGVFIGYELAREGNRITIRTEKGHKMTLVSDDIRPAKSHKATGIKRRIE